MLTCSTDVNLVYAKALANLLNGKLNVIGQDFNDNYIVEYISPYIPKTEDDIRWRLDFKTTFENTFESSFEIENNFESQIEITFESELVDKIKIYHVNESTVVVHINNQKAFTFKVK